MSGESAGTDETLEARVAGRVQGVGFRYFVYGEARKLGLSGSVRNLPDGGVLVQARGGRAALERLAERLRAGPPLASVEEVRLEWGAPVAPRKGFEIGH